VKPRTGELARRQGLTPEQALERGLVYVPPDEVERVQAMSEEERLAWVRAQMVKTELPGGVTRAQPVAPLIERGLARRAEKNRNRRVRQGREAAPAEERPAGWVILREGGS
jgi:hypothetical protein